VPLECDGDWVWALDDAFSVYLAYLAEALETSSAAEAPWVRDLVEHAQRASVLADHAMIIEPDSEGQRLVIREAAARAREAATQRGDVIRAQLRDWTFHAFDDLPVSAGISRTGDAVELARVLEVAAALEGMLDGTLPPRAIYQRWFVGTGSGWATIEMLDP